MRLWIKRTIVISLTLLWFTLSILLLRFVDNTAVKVISIFILVALAAVSVVSGYIYVNDLREANMGSTKKHKIKLLDYSGFVIKE